MKRLLYEQLKTWQQTPDRKPLLLMGVRQVGKTTLLKKFGKSEYKNLVCLNFDDYPSYKSFFTTDLDPHRIIKDISLAMNVTITPEDTLLFFDEIQECPEALNSLKYFNEKANEYAICAAGSLLGVKLAHCQGFPVGKVHFKTLYPLNFVEFLNATGDEQLSEHLSTLTLHDTINPAIHNKLLQRLRYYFLIGGMPEAINKYKLTENLAEVRIIHRDIIKAYNLDFTKHAPASLIMKITDCFHAIPAQLAKENKKFIYSVIREGARARNYEEAVQWLQEAGLIYKLFNTNTPKLPLSAYENRSIFKTYLVDVGLLNTLADLPLQSILDEYRLFQEFRGSLTENYVTQELVQLEQNLYYWTSHGRAEIDFVLRYNESILPIEIKSGQSSHKKSLAYYREKYKPKLAIRLSPKNLIMQDKLINIPLYLTGQLHRLLQLL